MEKSVLLELIEKRDQSYEDMIRKASIFDITEDIEKKFNTIFSKLDEIKNYIENTKVKDTTIEKVNAATVESMKVIDNTDKFLTKVLQKSSNELLWGNQVEEIEAILSQNAKKDLDDLKAAEEQNIINIVNNKKVTLTPEVKAELTKLSKKQKLNDKQMADLVALRNIISKKYLNDAKRDSKKRLAAIPFKDEEKEEFIGLLDELYATISSKKNTKGATATKGNGNTTPSNGTGAATATKGNGNTTPSNGTGAATATKGKGNTTPSNGNTQPTQTPKKVTTVNKNKNKNGKVVGRVLAVIAAIGATVLTIWLLTHLKGCQKDKDITPIDTTSEPTASQTAEPSETEAPVIIPTININNETELEEYAKYLQDELKKQGIDMSVEDIKNAIKLVNVDFLEEKPFENREQVYNATEDAGKIATKLGTSTVLAEDPARQENLITERTLDDMIKNVVPGYNKANLNLTKHANGYSIYELLDQLTYILEHKDVYSAEDRENAAKLYNEVMARKVRTFTLTPNSTVGQYYLAMGMYEAEHQNIKDLTAGRLYGPMYGDEEQIDGSYGFICVEELQKYTRTGNTDNAFYTNYADMMLKGNTLTKGNN